MTDWQSLAGWLAIQGCPCGGFFVWKPLWDLGLPFESDVERHELADRIRAVRVHGADVWISRTDGRVNGPLVIAGA